MKEIKFDKVAEKLWINIEMTGLYFITYTYQLWAATTTEPPILTSPIKSGTNESPHDDYFCVNNDFVPNEPVSNHNNRVVDVRLWIKKGDADNGYSLKVNVLQGQTFQTANSIGSDQVSGSVGSLSVKQEFITIKLQAN